MPLFKRIACIGLLALLAGCYYDKEELLYPGSNTAVDCNTISAKFSADVAPIISSQCATSGCHNATAAGGIVLQTHAQISAAKARIQTRALTEKTMPPSGPLPAAQVNAIQCWINSGAPNN
jgi:uncharacterized membrane protein